MLYWSAGSMGSLLINRVDGEGYWSMGSMGSLSINRVDGEGEGEIVLVVG